MVSPEEKRRLRTERQRERRAAEKICGYCDEPADAGATKWMTRGSPIPIFICNPCLARLAGCWLDLKDVGVWCPVDEQRPCADCMPVGEESRDDAICGYCQGEAGKVIEWVGRSGTRRLQICHDCLASLAGIWRDMGEFGVWCPVDEQRPCFDCIPRVTGRRPQGGIFHRLLSR